MIVYLAREPDGWYVRLDSGEPDPPVVRPAALVCSPSAEAWFRRGRVPALCAYCRAGFVPTRRGHCYCGRACQRRGQRG